MPPRRRQPLSPDRVIDAAVSVADRGGVAAVSMRNVAEVLGVEAMALYHHVPNKDAILNRIVDAVFAEIDVPEPTPHWRRALEECSRSARKAIARHSWVLGLVESREHVGPARLRHIDAVLGLLLEAGFSAIEAVQATTLLDGYVYGFVLQERQQGIEVPADTELAASALLADPSSEDLPHLRAVAQAVAAGPAPSHDDVFDHGLRIILDGLVPSGA
ncbi:TetR/AcrR family transcriptional regulator [Nocardioides sp. NPDC051685]|uniref:TetR/AcrR family transcriptional regulator n=1 Tax=Nocardioides sp. NPDC051685 TaxID=3364334 RepID=UPI0037A977C8